MGWGVFVRVNGFDFFSGALSISVPTPLGVACIHLASGRIVDRTPGERGMDE